MKQKNFSPEFKFYQLFPSIFLVEIDGNKELAYTFLRVQEFYESANPKIQGKKFTFKEYEEWYCTQSKDGTFSYGEDWKGFNVPYSVISECYSINDERLPQDLFFLELCEKAINLSSNKFYLLGVRKGDVKTLDHEIAHGLFSTNEEYNKLMTNLVKKLPKKVFNYLTNYLSEIGYSKNVHIDEIQAYMSTGLRIDMDHNLLNNYMNSFEEVFKNFVKDFDVKNIENYEVKYKKNKIK